MQTIREYIKENENHMNALKFARSKQVQDFVEQSDLFNYDAIAYDEDTDEICKVIYIDPERTQTWAISDILTYYTKEQVPEDRQEIWEKYMSQYKWQDPSYYNARNLIDKLKEQV